MMIESNGRLLEVGCRCTTMSSGSHTVDKSEAQKVYNPSPPEKNQ